MGKSLNKLELCLKKVKPVFLLDPYLTWSTFSPNHAAQYCNNDSPEVMDGNLGMLAHNFVLVVHVSGGEVDEDVNDEHDVNCNEAHIIQAHHTCITNLINLLSRWGLSRTVLIPYHCNQVH